MRKFNLFDKVLFTPQDESEKKVGCIVGLVSDEEDGVIIDKESGAVLEPEEHCYLVLEDEVRFSDTEAGVNISEYMESDLQSAQ